MQFWIMLKEVDAVGPDAAQLAVEIGLARAERRHRRGDRRIFMRPVEPGARQQPHRAAVEPRMHAVAVEFDFVEPVRPSGAASTSWVSCGFTQLGSAVASPRRHSSSDRTIKSGPLTRRGGAPSESPCRNRSCSEQS